MLCKFTVNNFKSLVNVTYEPGGVNLLIGVNSSGKTNFCQALRFLSQLAHTRGKAIFRIWQDVTERTPPNLARNLYVDHPTMDLGCTCELTVDGQALTFRYALTIRPEGAFSVQAETLQVSGGAHGADGVTLLQNKAGRIRLLDEERYLRGVSPNDCYQDAVMQNSATMLSLLYDKGANRRAIAFREYLTGWQFYDMAPHRLRGDRLDPQADVLKPDGANLVSALFHLKKYNEDCYRRLIELVKTVEPRLDALDFTTIGDYVQMELVDTQGHRFSVPSISDGTLRFMALCYVILSNACQRIPALIVIEEPEGGLYVPALGALFEMLDASGVGGQYIFTSHSLYLVALLDAHLENVIMVQDQGTHSTLTRPDLAETCEYLAKIPVDKLYM
jgi:predicted ATPase